MSSSLSENPVGVFDSGVGGLSVLRHIAEALPHENLIYIADSANTPYGEKTPEWIAERSLAIGHALVEKGAKTLVIACNTATAAAAPLMRKVFNVPVVAMEPAIKPAVSRTQNQKIGVLATTGTLESARFAALLDRFAQDVEVFTEPCIGWVEAVETGLPVTESIVKEHVDPLMDKGVDTLILGCTHYPFLADLIQRVAGEDIALIETGNAVAQRLQAVLKETDLLNTSSREGTTEFYNSGDVEKLHAVMERLWGRSLELHPF